VQRHPRHITEKAHQTVSGNAGNSRRFVKMDVVAQILLDIDHGGVELFEHIHPFHLPRTVYQRGFCDARLFGGGSGIIRISRHGLHKRPVIRKYGPVSYPAGKKQVSRRGSRQTRLAFKK
jgi:hypothetical protein